VLALHCSAPPSVASSDEGRRSFCPSLGSPPVSSDSAAPHFPCGREHLQESPPGPLCLACLSDAAYLLPVLTLIFEFFSSLAGPFAGLFSFPASSAVGSIWFVPPFFPGPFSHFQLTCFELWR